MKSAASFNLRFSRPLACLLGFIAAYFAATKGARPGQPEINDTYLYLSNLVGVAQASGNEALLVALERLSVGGRPVLYQLLAWPLVEISPTEEAALWVNLAFLMLLVCATARIGDLIGGD